MKTKNKKSLSADFMPNSASDLNILRQRAEFLAKQDITDTENKNLISYIRFRLGENEHYGIPYHHAKEVMRNIIPTILPNVPRFIAGVINRRGALIAVVDLKQLFHSSATKYDKEAHVIIIEGKDITIGVLTNNIEGSGEYDPNLLDAPLHFNNAIKSNYILGLHHGTTAIIQVEAVIADCELQIKQTVRV